MADYAGLAQYPNSDVDGNVYPFDVGNPYGLIVESVAVASSASFDMGADALGLIAILFATVRTIVRFDGTAAVATERSLNTSQVIVPAGGKNAIVVREQYLRCISADGASTGKLYVQLYRPWKAGGVAQLQSNM